MNPQEQALLQQLKDVALPANPGWWPPAPGWWLLLFALLLLLVVMYRLINKQSTRKSQDEWRRAALKEHHRLYQLSHTDAYQGDHQTGLIAELSVLMRRVALAVEPRSRIASLTDDNWLAKLDAIGVTNEYTAGVGRVLYRHQYQRSNTLDNDAVQDLFRLTANTITKASIDVQQMEGSPVAAL